MALSLTPFVPGVETFDVEVIKRCVFPQIVVDGVPAENSVDMLIRAARCSAKACELCI
jgi:hypothetical protein